MKAIMTKYHPPTSNRCSKLSARDDDGNRVTMSYPPSLTGMDAHAEVAKALCHKMGWHGTLVGGGLKDNYVFTFQSTAGYGHYKV